MSTLDRRKVERERMVRAGLVEPNQGQKEQRWSEEGMVPLAKFDTTRGMSEPEAPAFVKAAVARHVAKPPKPEPTAQTYAELAAVTLLEGLGYLIIRHEDVTAFQIMQETCVEFDTTIPLLKGDCRARKIARARHKAMARLRIELGMSYPAIARYMGGRDHTSVMHACRKLGVA